MERKKIALIDPVGTKASMDTYNTSLLSALWQNDVEGLLYSNFHWTENPDHAFPFFSDSIGHNLSDIVLLPLKYLKVIRHLKNRRCSSVIIHIFHFNRLDEWILRKLRENNLQSIVIVHDVDSFVHSTDHSRMKRICDDLADVLVVHSEFVRSELMSRISASAAKKINVIPHGDFLSLASSGTSKTEARIMLKLDPDLPLVLFFGMIKPTKGMATLLRAWKFVQSNSTLFIAGRLRNISFKPFQTIIDEVPQSKNVRLMIRQVSKEERDLLFRSADLIVLPYTRIYHSGVLLMAMSYGVPVIVSRLGGFEETIKHELNGLLFDPENSVELATTINRLITDVSLSKKLSNNALQTILIHHGWNNIAIKFKALLS